MRHLAVEGALCLLQHAAEIGVFLFQFARRLQQHLALAPRVLGALALQRHLVLRKHGSTLQASLVSVGGGRERTTVS